MTILTKAVLLLHRITRMAKKRKKSTAADETKLSEKQKATKELNEHSWVEEAGKHPLPYEVVEGKAVSEEELAHWWKVF